MIRLEEITKDAIVRGIIPNESVTVRSIDPVGENALSLIYMDSSGNIKERMLFRSDESTLELVTEGRPWSFDGDGGDFRLAAEACRIQLAHLFDPLMAVHSSNVEPLPHQITAVYEAMLPRQPLRFVLADDPGAGKTIMAGLLIRELMIRGDVQRCLVIAPGSLVEQWQDELLSKFGVEFRILNRELIDACATGNPFRDQEKALMICRLDQLSRNEELQAKLLDSDWDLVIFDEAHKLSASFWGSEIKKTQRYKLAESVGAKTRHLLLMTATPHNGKEEDFQLFMALLDSDRFFGKFRDGVHTIDISDLMRRMVKEDLLTFEGTRLFPERKAYTANYKLSDEEAALYEAVTEYVREGMNRAERLDKGRKGTVGFALTILQRRLASSPEAIYKSIERRRKRLERRLEEEKLLERGLSARVSEDLIPSYEDHEIEDLYDELAEEEMETLEEELVDKATPAQTIAELETEILDLKRLEKQALDLRSSGRDKKWEELSSLLQDGPHMRDSFGNLRKLIIFTEHRDTLSYLYEKVTGLLGNTDGVECIHGGVKREERRKIQEKFTQNKDTVVLIATDAAGEGINLQRANLMINYDLPWNPNRLEQRFGRIHRIGQKEVCHLWNMVAMETREGDVFQRLFDKLNNERETLGGRVFDILGDIFENTSLRDLLIEAIRYGNDPEVRARFHEKVDGALNHEHIKEILSRNALDTESMGFEKLYMVKEEMEKAQARKLHPHFIKSFFQAAFNKLAGKMYEREPGRYEITYVPSQLRQRDRQMGAGVTVLKAYERVCFEKEKVTVEGKPLASLLTPGHGLMDSLIDSVLEKYRELLKRGCVFIDPADDGTEPKVLFIIDHKVTDGTTVMGGAERVISHRMQFVLIGEDGKTTRGGHAPYLDFEPAGNDLDPLVSRITGEPWLKRDLEKQAMAYAVSTIVPEHFTEVKERRISTIDKILEAVQTRLVGEINYWAKRYLAFKELVEAGKQPKMQPENARRKAEELTERFERRRSDLERQRQIISKTPRIVGGALVIPRGLVETYLGNPLPEWSVDADARKVIEMAAMKAVMKKEISLGFMPEDVSDQKRGWDIESRDGRGNLRFIEVKGRIRGASTVTVTRNEILACFNQPDRFILAIVIVDNGIADSPTYITQPFRTEPDFGVCSINYNIGELLKMGQDTVGGVAH